MRTSPRSSRPDSATWLASLKPSMQHGPDARPQVPPGIVSPSATTLRQAPAVHTTTSCLSALVIVQSSIWLLLLRNGPRVTRLRGRVPAAVSLPPSRTLVIGPSIARYRFDLETAPPDGTRLPCP